MKCKNRDKKGVDRATVRLQRGGKKNYAVVFGLKSPPAAIFIHVVFGETSTT